MFGGHTMEYIWGKTFVTNTKIGDFRGIAFSSDGKVVMTHTDSTGMIIFFRVCDGGVINARIYSNSHSSYMKTMDSMLIRGGE